MKNDAVNHPEPTNPEYERQRMAEVIAEITSGVKNAIPEQDDFDTSAELIQIIEDKLDL